MKNDSHILIFLTAAFICILFGFYIGRNKLYGIHISPFGNVVNSEGNSNAMNINKVDINTAKEAELQTIPGVGETIAKNIIAYREKNGPFVAIIELLNVDGIGKTTLNKMLDHIYISN